MIEQSAAKFAGLDNEHVVEEFAYLNFGVGTDRRFIDSVGNLTEPDVDRWDAGREIERARRLRQALEFLLEEGGLHRVKP